MKYAAEINKNNVVTNICIVEDLETQTGLIEYTEENPAYIGGDYFDGYFYPAQPFSSWTRDKGNWIPPVLEPQDGKFYLWVEADLNWQLVPTE